MRKQYDVFNGDADGICALHQLRLAEPRPAAELVTGVKRDVRLLKKLHGVRNAEITVLDISLDSNRDDLYSLLESCKIFYVDHHFPGEIPKSSNLEAHIDPSPDLCTALIVDRLLAGRFRGWAVAAAYGDNLHGVAVKAAQPLALTEEKLAQLREIGELLNYNGYGKTVDDLYFTPQNMYNAIKPFVDPFDFYDQSEQLDRLRKGFIEDMARAVDRAPFKQFLTGRVFRFPGEPWSRRVMGVFANQVARERQDLAHALIIDNPDGTFTVSIRAPLKNKTGADTLCRSFPTGGGRAAAAGINALPGHQLPDFLNSFEEAFK
ncbi:MAG: acetyltransferase [Proteobacteria bacterium]|nr:acetyltransferase [Pseudomonadota bacterium]MBU1716612.1 acetyltransferase [Pseudomonadota bacterium]